MSDPVIQYFATSGTWVKPPNAVRVDIVLRGGDGGAATEDTGGYGGGASFAHLAGDVIPVAAGNVTPASGTSPASGRLGVLSYDADDLPETIEVEVGKGGRPGGRDGYALIITHLSGTAGDIERLVDHALGYPAQEQAEGGQR